MKLTELRDLLGASSDPRGFGHNFIFRKIRLMRKKSLSRLKNGQIFYASRRLKMLKKCNGVTFWRRKSILRVVWHCSFALHILEISYYIIQTYLRCKQRVKKFLGVFKIQNSPSKVIKYQNILPITTFENVEKMQRSHVLEAQINFTCRMNLLFCSTYSLHARK